MVLASAYRPTGFSISYQLARGILGPSHKNARRITLVPARLYLAHPPGLEPGTVGFEGRFGVVT